MNVYTLKYGYMTANRPKIAHKSSKLTHKKFGNSNFFYYMLKNLAIYHHKKTI
jgi:hypothetical protein